MADPVDDLYFPATHDIHGPPFGPVDPMLQVHAAKDEAPADELEFSGQERHVDGDPVEYVPGPQSMTRCTLLMLVLACHTFLVVSASGIPRDTSAKSHD
jgi:hypothetical protein